MAMAHLQWRHFGPFTMAPFPSPTIITTPRGACPPPPEGCYACARSAERNAVSLAQTHLHVAEIYQHPSVPPEIGQIRVLVPRAPAHDETQRGHSTIRTVPGRDNNISRRAQPAPEKKCMEKSTRRASKACTPTLKGLSRRANKASQLYTCNIYIYRYSVYSQENI